MRITQGMLSNDMLMNLSKSYSSLGTYMDQLSTGKKINKPSDDPVVAMKGINYRTQLLEVEQFKRNTNEVHNWMNSSDATLDKATQAMQKLRELSVQASNGTYDDDERKAIMEEAEQLKEHLIDIANTKVNDKYIFNGTNTGEAPFDENGDVISATKPNPVTIEVAKGTKLQANVDPASIFGEKLYEDNDGDGKADGDNMFDHLDTFIDALKNNDQGGIEKSIATIDGDINTIINARADLGARMNRLDLVENRLDEQIITATKTMSENEDIDYEQVITNLITQESLHRAALSAGSRIIQPTLLDFLR